MLNNDLNLIVRKLETHHALEDVDRQAVVDLPFTKRSACAGTYLVREGEPPLTCSFLLAGFAIRHKIAGDGGRQIMALQIPGESLDFQGLYLDCSDHNVQTLTPATLAVVPMTALRLLMAERPLLARAVLTTLMVEGSISREWIINVGRRDARTRLAHLLCEFACRMDAQGLCGTSYELPMTQEQLGDVLGLTSVHVNRSIRMLEAEGLIGRDKRTITFPNVRRLREIADFSTLYLHLSMKALPN